MNFLDKNGLNHLWTKIKASFGTAIVESSQNSNIPFVTNHQIVNVNRSGNINVYDWFQKASKGQILSQVIRFTNFNDKKAIDIVLKDATSQMAGFMSIRDKNKLDTIADGATADSAIPISVIDALN